ncbi:MAG: hypothetical protein FK733_08430 [Asgard group archaeon]|nr:hypothetical protein [Asgard group archaeon]
MGLSDTSALILAISLQLISASVNYIGMTIQKKAATEMPKIGKETGLGKSFKNMITNKAWLLGFLLNSSSTFLAAGSFALASITIMQPLYGFGLIVLVIFIHFYLKEKITRLDIVGVIFGIVGIITIGVTAKPIPKMTYTELLDKFLGSEYRGVIFFAVILSIALITYFVSDRTKKNISLVFLVISSAIWTSTQNIFNKAVATSVRHGGFVEAFFGEGWLYTWTFVLLFILVSVIGIIMLNIAYQDGHGVIILPIWTAIQVVVPVLSGVIIFEEWSSAYYSPTEKGIQSLGMIIMLTSIVILSISSGKKEDFRKLVTQPKTSNDIENQQIEDNEISNS